MIILVIMDQWKELIVLNTVVWLAAENSHARARLTQMSIQIQNLGYMYCSQDSGVVRILSFTVIMATSMSFVISRYVSFQLLLPDVCKYI